MKLLVTIISLFVSFSCNAQALDTKIGVISDIHYLTEQYMDNGKAIKNYVATSGRDVISEPEILDAVIADYLKSDINVLLISGDMTKDGAKLSHIELVDKLQLLINKGVNIYVVPGNHDINVPNPQRYEDDKTYPVENTSPADFVSIYANCGYNSALKRDSASLSYVAQLDANTWLLAIDSNRYKEYTTSIISGGRIEPSTEQWIVDVLDEAKLKGIRVIGMMHHGLVEHIMYQDLLFGEYLVEDYQRLAALFADKGMKAVFTGHFHANDITAYTSKSGNQIYDIETASLISYPFAYRFVTLNNEGMDISTNNIVSIPTNNNLAEDNKHTLKALAKKIALVKLKKQKLDLPDDISEKIANIASQIFILHMQGDEVVSKSLEKDIQSLISDLGIPFEDYEAPLELDYYPADNNVKISFSK